MHPREPRNGCDRTEPAAWNPLPMDDPIGNARKAVQWYGLDPVLLDAVEDAEHERDRDALDKAVVEVLMAALEARGDRG